MFEEDLAEFLKSCNFDQLFSAHDAFHIQVFANAQGKLKKIKKKKVLPNLLLWIMCSRNGYRQ